MTLRLNGSTSGYVEIDAPAVAGSTSITIPATTGGEFVVSDSSGDVTTPKSIAPATDNSAYLFASRFSSGYGGSVLNTTGSSTFLSLQIENVEKARILSTGGLTFNGDTAAANALDDYEEGTWTPTIDIGGLTAGITYSSQAGIYTKIGDVVTVGCYVILSSKGLNTGTVRIDGLPFAANIPVGPVNAGVLVNEVNNANWPQSMSYGLVWSDGYVYLRYNGTTAWAGITDTNLTNNSQIYWSSTFKVS